MNRQTLKPIHLWFILWVFFSFFFKQRGEKILVLKRKFKPGHNSADSSAYGDSGVQDESLSKVRAHTGSSSTHGADQSADTNSNHLSNASSISSVASTVSMSTIFSNFIIMINHVYLPGPGAGLKILENKWSFVCMIHTACVCF